MHQEDQPNSPKNTEVNSSLNNNSSKEELTQSNSLDSKVDQNEIKEERNIQDGSHNFFQIALKELQARRDSLEKEINELNRRKIQLEKEQKNNFTGQSDAIARRVKGFQEYLTGAMQELAQSAEHLELVNQPLVVKPSPLDQNQAKQENAPQLQTPAVADTFQPDQDFIQECLENFLGQPDFYAEPWKLRRSLENKDIALLEDWFFSMGGRGAQPSRGNRPKNILVSAGLISILGELYGDRFQTLVLASQPERLGEWRRGLQDCLGLTRDDFGPNSGIMLFERADGLVERADRLEESNEVPLILIDALEQSIPIPILQFPLWLAFSAGPEELYEEEEFI